MVKKKLLFVQAGIIVTCISGLHPRIKVVFLRI